MADFRLTSPVLGELNWMNVCDLSFNMTPNGIVKRTDFDFDAQICLSPTQLDLIELTLSENPCGAFCISFQGACKSPFVQWQELWQVKLDVSRISTADCSQPCNIILPLAKNNGLAELERNESQEICTSIVDDYEIPQYQSGAPHLNDDLTPITAPFIRFSELIASLSDELTALCDGATTDTVGVFNRPFLNQIECLDISTASAGDLIEIQIESRLGSIFVIDVVAGATESETAERIRQALLCDEYPANQQYTPDAREIVHRLTNVTYDSPCVLVEADYPFTVTQFDVAGNPVTPVNQQAWQYGLEDFAISGQGLSDPICISWQMIKQILKTVTPGIVVSESGTDISLELSSEKYDISNAANSSTLTPPVAECNPAEEKLKGKIQLGNDFDYQDIEQSLIDWRPYGDSISIPNPNFIFTINAGAPDFHPVGTGNFTGCVDVTNTGGAFSTIQIDILLNGVLVTSPVAVNINAGQTLTFCVDPQNGEEQIKIKQDFITGFCLGDGDTIQYQINGLGGSTFVFSNSSLGLNVTAGYDALSPSIKEYFNMYFGSLRTNDTSLAGCSGILDCTIPDNVYNGMGIALGQQVEGFTDYSDTYFLNFIDGDSLKRWQRVVYFPDEAGTYPCWNDEYVSFFFHNMPLQYPFLKYLSSIHQPFSITAPAYTFTASVDASGALICSTSQASRGLPALNSFRYRYTFPYCDTFGQTYTRILQQVAFADPCGSGEKAAVIESLSFNLCSGEGQYTICTNAPDFDISTTTGNPPTANQLALTLPSGIPKVDEPLDGQWFFSDSDLDALNIGATDVQLWCYPDAAGAGAGTFLQNLTHVAGTTTVNGNKVLEQITIPATAAGKYIALLVTPVSLGLPSTGTTAIYILPNKIIPKQEALCLFTNATGGDPFPFQVQFAAGEQYVLEFSDATAPQLFTGTGNLVSHSHTFQAVGTPNKVTVCGDPLNVLGLRAPNSQLTGTLDLTENLNLNGPLEIQGNATFDCLELPTLGNPILTTIRLDDTNVKDLIFGSVKGNNTGVVSAVNVPNLSIFQTNTAEADMCYTGLILQQTALINADANNFNSVTAFAISGNPSLTDITYPTNNTIKTTNFQTHNNPVLAGNCADLTGFQAGLCGIFWSYNTCNVCYNFPPQAVFDALVLSGDFFTQFRVEGQKLVNPDFTMLTNLGGRVRMGNQATGIGIVSNPTGPMAGTFFEFNIGNAGLTSLLGFENYVNWFPDSNILYGNNPALTVIDMPTMLSGSIDTLIGSATGIDTLADHDTPDLILSTTAVNFEHDSSGLTAAQVDAFLSHYDSVLGTGTGTITLTNNQPPTAAGNVFKTSLQAKGYTVLTD